ncbi:MFS transporter [Parachryseolinea silvisoli]|uniref:MFS transporter n=1 Tax=Parachryseolinea silvisoli TaxID=2873601 RepID=UPI002265D939|nr:MFS transporter [Parachryseolinea silvisoli]MCD9013948.1 MFS transporter [Parachryseolinea silvisoli]
MNSNRVDRKEPETSATTAAETGGLSSARVLAAQQNKVSIRLAVTVFFFTQGICFASWASRIPDIKLLLGLNDAQLGTILFALPAGLMTSLPLSGWAVTRFGSRRMLLVGATLYTLTMVVIGLVTDRWELAGVLFMFGLFGNLVNIAVNTQAIGVEALYGKSIMASFHGAWSLAGFSGASIAWFMVSLNIAPFHHFCMIAGLVVVLVALAYKRTLPAMRGSSDTPLFARPDGLLLRLGIIGFFGMACEGTMFDWSGVYFQKIVEAPEKLVTLGYVAFMGTMTGGRFIGDALSNRLGRKKMLQLSGALITTGLLVSVLFPMLVTATIGFLLVGFGVSSVVPLVYGAAGKSGTLSPGVALAAVSTISFFGFLLGPPVIGWIAEVASLRFSFALIACLGSGIAILATRSRLLQ